MRLLAREDATLAAGAVGIVLSSTHQWSGALIADPVNASSQLEGSRSTRQLERGSTNSARIVHGPVLESNEEEEPMEEAEPTEPIW